MQVFKEVFSHKEEMQDFIVHTFPPDIVKQIDFDTLTYDNTSYTDKRLRKYFSDLVYTCVLSHEVPIKIAILFEHKSKPVEYPHFQLLTYILKIWESCIKIAVFLLKYIFNKKMLQQKFETFFKDNPLKEIDNDTSFLIQFYEYLLNNLNSTEMETVVKKIGRYSTPEGSILIRNFARRHFKKGIAKGKTEGIEEGIEKRNKEIVQKMIIQGFPNDFIKGLIEMTDQEIDEIREEQNNSNK